MRNMKIDLSDNKNTSYLKGLKEHLKEKLIFYEKQIDSSNQLNRMAKSILSSYNYKDQSKDLLAKSKSLFPKEKRNFSHTSKIGSKRAAKQVRTSGCDLINYVKLRQTYMQHANYWHQVWLFTENPLFQFDNDSNGAPLESFVNPFYDYLNNKENFSMIYDNNLDNFCTRSREFKQEFDKKNAQIENSLTFSSTSNIYESITDFDLNEDSTGIGSANSNDSGIHSSTNGTIDGRFKTRPKAKADNQLDNRNSNSTIESLYSSVISSKKSMDTLATSRDLSRDVSSTKLADDKSCTNSHGNEELEEEDYTNINHLEQHELPLGWVKCCDEAGIYYWHKPSGTVTRKPPVTTKSTLECESEKKLDLAEMRRDDANRLTLSSVSSTSAYSSSSSSQMKSAEHLLDDISTQNDYDALVENGDEEEEEEDEGMLKSEQKNKMSNRVSTSSSSSTSSSTYAKSTSDPLVRFYVRSLGWVKIDEKDLTQDRSSQAVNKCINDLSKGKKDFNDVVARWGQGKDLYMDLSDSFLFLIDPSDEKVLNKLPLTSIRVWGVGRDNRRDFAYVARDKHTKQHMCHVFRCDSAPAKEIASALRDACKKLMAEKKASTTSATITSNPQLVGLRRPNLFTEFSTRSASMQNIGMKTFNYSNSFNEQLVENSSLVKNADEQRKTIRCKYLGCSKVSKPSGMGVLNEAIEKIYAQAVEDLKRQRLRNKLRRLKLRQEEESDFVSQRKDKVGDDEDDDDDEEDVQGEFDVDSTISFDDTLDLKYESKLGKEVDVTISPSTISVRKVSNDVDVSEFSLLFECRIRYLSFMGISNDIRLSGFIMDCIDKTFTCHAFLCENSSGLLCKTIEAACKLRFQKCLDAHPELASENDKSKQQQQQQGLLSIGTHLKSMLIDSFINRGFFNSNNNSNNFASNK